MKINFLNLPEEERKALIEKASNQFVMPPAIIEKDIWICWLLEKIFSLNIKMAFKGGTSLSKTFNLINRFSEDCDITIDYRHFDPDLNLKTTRSHLKTISSQLKEKLKDCITNKVLPFLEMEINKLPGKDCFKITLSDDGEKLQFYYQSAVNEMFLVTEDGANIITEDGNSMITEKSNTYLRDHVLIEFGVRNTTEPCKKYELKTYVSEVIATDLCLPKPIINVLSPIRTFFEKLTLIHVECHKDSTKSTPDRFSRHWYDLYKLHNSWVSKEALSQIEILESVIEHKNAFFKYNYASYEDCLSGKLRLIPNEIYLSSLKKDYEDMINSGMFNETPPSFEEILNDLSKLANNINKHLTTKVKITT